MKVISGGSHNTALGSSCVHKRRTKEICHHQLVTQRLLRTYRHDGTEGLEAGEAFRHAPLTTPRQFFVDNMKEGDDVA